MIYDKYLMLPLKDLPHYEGLAPPKWGHRLSIRSATDGENRGFPAILSLKTSENGSTNVIMISLAQPG